MVTNLQPSEHQGKTVSQQWEFLETYGVTSYGSGWSWRLIVSQTLCAAPDFSIFHFPPKSDNCRWWPHKILKYLLFDHLIRHLSQQNSYDCQRRLHARVLPCNRYNGAGVNYLSIVDVTYIDRIKHKDQTQTSFHDGVLYWRGTADSLPL